MGYCTMGLQARKIFRVCVFKKQKLKKYYTEENFGKM